MSAPTGARGRRTQAERRATTRSALLNAAAACLVERGFAGTTFAEIQVRAGVSPGALTHYFPTKNALLVAAMEQVLFKHLERLRAAAGRCTGEDRLETSVRSLWSVCMEPEVQAFWELFLAARTDESLHRALVAHEQEFASATYEVALELFGPDITSHPSFQHVFNLLLHAMRFAAMTSRIRPPGPRAGYDIQAWTNLVRSMLEQP